MPIAFLCKPGARCDIKVLPDVAGVIFDHGARRSYFMPPKTIPTYRVKANGTLVPGPNVVLYAQEHDEPLHLPAGPEGITMAALLKAHPQAAPASNNSNGNAPAQNGTAPPAGLPPWKLEPPITITDKSTRHERIHALAQEGNAVAKIARDLAMNRKSVQVWLSKPLPAFISTHRNGKTEAEPEGPTPVRGYLFDGPWRGVEQASQLDRIEVENNMIQIEQHKQDSAVNPIEKYDKWITMGLVFMLIVNIFSIGWAAIQRGG